MSQLPWIRAHLPAELHLAPQLAVYYLGLNMRKPPLSTSRELRQALSMVIDRGRLVEAVTGAGETAAYNLVPPQVRGYSAPLPDYARWSMSQRIAQARQLLAQMQILGIGKHQRQRSRRGLVEDDVLSDLTANAETSFLQKPFHSPDLLTLVRNHMECSS